MRAILRDANLTELFSQKAISWGDIVRIRKYMREKEGFTETSVHYTGKFSHIVTFEEGGRVAYLDIC